METTLRTDIAIQQAKRARAAGFRLEMVFVATESADQNVQRVARRGLLGGHSAPASTIRKIYDASLANLYAALQVFDDVRLFDSSAHDRPPRMVARFVDRHVFWRTDPLPSWCATGALAALINQEGA